MTSRCRNSEEPSTSLPADTCVSATKLAESYRYCIRLTRRAAGNFYFTFLTLPRDRYRAMCALYAFMRVTDDLGDDEQVRLAERVVRLGQWRESLRRLIERQLDPHPVLPALSDIIERFRIPPEYLFDVIEGVEMDLTPVRMTTFDELSDYCYHVAGAVGLCCISIWGFQGEGAIPAAIDCGQALQLTNILRDLAEDADRGRTYLPQEDLDRFGYTADDLRQRVCDQRFRALMQFEVERARGYYRRAEALFQHLDPPGRAILDAMLRIYGGVLQRIEHQRYDVFTRRAELPAWRKLAIAGGAVLRQRWRG